MIESTRVVRSAEGGEQRGSAWRSNSSSKTAGETVESRAAGADNISKSEIRLRGEGKATRGSLLPLEEFFL